MIQQHYIIGKAISPFLPDRVTIDAPLLSLHRSKFSTVVAVAGLMPQKLKGKLSVGRAADGMNFHLDL